MSIVRNPEVRMAIDRALSGGGAAGDWTLDPVGHSVRFRSKTYWGLRMAHGSFAEVAGAAQVSSDGMISGTLVIRTGSVDTGNAGWDTRLRSKRFLDAEDHPELTVEVTAADRIGNARLLLTGALDVAGTSRPVTVDAEVIALDDDEVRLRVEFDLTRSGLGLGWSMLGMIGDKVHVHAEVHFTRSEASGGGEG